MEEVPKGCEKRLRKEIEELRKANVECFHNFQVDDKNILKWYGLIVPDCAPYDKGAFRLEINFPPDYPFKRPTLKFKTKIYHLNVGLTGHIDMPSTCSSNSWSPATRAIHLIQDTIAILKEPDFDHSMRWELTREYKNDRKKFFRNAELFTKKFAEKRPECMHLEGKSCELPRRTDEKTAPSEVLVEGKCRDVGPSSQLNPSLGNEFSEGCTTETNYNKNSQFEGSVPLRKTDTEAAPSEVLVEGKCMEVSLFSSSSQNETGEYSKGNTFKENSEELKEVSKKIPTDQVWVQLEGKCTSPV